MVKESKEGVEEIKSLYQPEDIGLVTITSVSMKRDNHPLYVNLLTHALGFQFPEENVHGYVPPPNVGYCQSGFTKKMFNITTLREEEIPIVNPKLAYVILDDTYETGKTLEKAVEMLIEQKVDRNKLWFFTYRIEQYADGPFLDHVDNYPRRN